MKNINKASVTVILFLINTFMFIYISELYTNMGYLYLIGITAYHIFYFLFAKHRDYNTLIIVNVTTLIGIIQAVANYSDYLNTNDVYLYPDQLHSFYDRAVRLEQNAPSFIFILKDFFDNEYLNLSFIISCFASVLHLEAKLFGTQTLLSCLFLVSLISNFISVCIYKLLNIYVSRKKSFLYTIFYILFTTFTLYLSYALRDQFISLVFILALLVIHKPLGIRNIIVLLILSFIGYKLRVLNGVYLLILVVFYLFKSNINLSQSPRAQFSLKIFRVLVIIILAGVMLKFLFEISQVFSGLFDKLDVYEEFTNQVVAEKGGLSKYLYKLPTGLKQISIIIFSQINFPFWLSTSEADSFDRLIMGIISAMGTLGWSYVFYTLILNCKKAFRLTMANKVLLYLAVYFIVFLFLNSSNMTDRRIMCLYPIPFIVYTITYNKLSVYSKRLTLYSFIGINILLAFVYFLIK